MTRLIGTGERTAVCAPLFFIVLFACFTVFSPHLVQQTPGFFPGGAVSQGRRDSISGVLPAQEQFHILRADVSSRTVFRIQPFSGPSPAGSAEDIPLLFFASAGRLFFRTALLSFCPRCFGKHCPVRAGPVS